MTSGFRNIFAALLAVVTFTAMAVLPAAAANRVVTIVNNTAFTIVEFYGSNIGSTSWEEDILGLDVIPAYSSMRINFDDGSGYCVFDFKAVFNDGDVLIRKRVNVCEISTYTYN